MGGTLFTVIAFVVALGVLITVHEFGHFWVARRMGVKVLRFSIGFGRTLWSRRFGADQTEFAVAVIPLGGYVKMVDEREEEVAEEDLPRAFNRQPLAARAAIVAAGPVFNFLFAILAYWLMFMVGVTGLKPIIGSVDPGSLAERAGFQVLDEIVEVSGKPTPTWDSTILTLFESMFDRGLVDVRVEDEYGSLRSRNLDLRHADALEDAASLLDTIGLHPYRPSFPAVIDSVEPDSPAQRAGLLAGDRIVRADGESISSWSRWVEVVRARPAQTIHVEVERASRIVSVELVPEAVEQDGSRVGRIGARARVPGDLLADLRTTVRYGPVKALLHAVEKTWDTSLLTLRMIGRMITGEASVKNVSGPISIAQYAGYSASLGLSPFLAFLALVSLSLGVLNLLPVPILDGGHLMYYFIEFLKGGPVSEQAQMIGQRIGLALLLCLMALAFYNDFARLLG